MSEATQKLRQTSEALTEAANETVDAEIRAEIAETAIEEANLEAEHARTFAAEAFRAAMNTELGKQIEVMQTCLEDLKSRVELAEANLQSSDVGDRLSKIEQLLKELEQMEEAERKAPPSTPQTSSVTVMPQSQKPAPKNENAKSEAPTKTRARKTNWF